MDRVSAWQRKAFTLLRVDRNHSLARNLLDCYVFGPAGNWGLTCLGDQRSHSNYGGGGPGSYRGAPEPSIYVGIDNTAGNVWWNVPNYINYAAGDFAVFVRFIPHSWPNSFNGLVNKLGGGGGELWLSLNAAGNVNECFAGGSGGGVGPLTTNFNLNTICDLCFSRTGGTITFYANGVNIGTAAIAGTTGSPTERLELGRSDHNANQGGDYQFTHLNIWSRALSTAEVLQLHLDPYAFLVPVFEPTFKTAAATVSAIVFRKTLSQIGGRVGSRQLQGWGH
jgi:hypothetical protein